MPNVPGYGDHAAPEPYETVTASEVEPKTIGGTAGAGIGAALSAFLIWGADQLWWGGDATPPDVPLPVSTLISVVVTGGCAFLLSYRSRHVQR